MVEEGQAIDGEGNTRIHIVQPHRDLESNWAVDLAKSLEDYLLKICSGEISGGETANFSVNFAEAALLLQGSIQVYSRKVEYLYSLVLQALEFISQKSDRTQDQEEDPASQPEASTSRAVRNEDDGQFWCSDDIPVDAKNSLDSLSTKDAFQNRLVKPPANLVVVEGDCLDSTGDGGELETYLLATLDLYRDFILLDPCDATVVDEFLEGNISGEGQYGTYKESSLRSKGPKTFMSPVRQTGVGTARKSTAKKNMNNFDEPSPVPCHIDPPAMSDFPQNGNFDFQMDDNHSEPEFFDDADSDDDDPWKPFNPHEPGNLKDRPLKKVKSTRRKSTRTKASATTIFPPLKPDGPIDPQFKVFWESRVDACDRQPASEPPPYFEKMRQGLQCGAQDIHGNHSMFHNPEGANNDEDNDDGFGDFDFNMPAAFGMDDDFNQEKHDDFGDTHNDNVANNPEDISSQATLEDLCRAHLDSLLASIAETEQQTELVARVTSWKQRIEHNLEEQDSRPPFDIHVYGERVLEKFSMDNDGEVMPFTDVVRGLEKHDIARTFSAMLQLVNEGKVHLDKPAATSSSFCYTSVNPFYVRCGSKQEVPEKRQFPLQKKRGNSPARKKRSKEADVNNGHASLGKSPQKNGKISAKKLGVPPMGRCTPESKRRRKSRLVDPPDLPSG